MLWTLAPVALALCGGPVALNACSSSVQVGEESDGSSSGTSSGTGGPNEVKCAGKVCSTGEACCMTTMQCYDPKAAPDACAPPDLPPNQQGYKACSSSAQCAATEFCKPANANLCLGPGYCTPKKTGCGSGTPVPACGCNGVSYPSIEAACLDGVAPIGPGTCGEPQGEGGGASGHSITFCASDDACPNGQACCYITARCYDTSKPALCAFPPEGTWLPCLDNIDCGPPYGYCSGPGCDGPGGCVSRPGSCPGDLAPVCGCDGKSYVNAECAAVGATRIAHDGDCTQ